MCVYFCVLLEVCELILLYVDVRFHAVDRCWYGELWLFHGISYVGFDLSEETPISQWVCLSISQWVCWNHVIGKCHGPVRFVTVCLNQEFLVAFFFSFIPSRSLTFPYKKEVMTRKRQLLNPVQYFGVRDLWCVNVTKKHTNTHTNKRNDNTKRLLRFRFLKFWVMY